MKSQIHAYRGPRRHRGRKATMSSSAAAASARSSSRADPAADRGRPPSGAAGRETLATLGVLADAAHRRGGARPLDASYRFLREVDIGCNGRRRADPYVADPTAAAWSARPLSRLLKGATHCGRAGGAARRGAAALMQAVRARAGRASRNATVSSFLSMPTDRETLNKARRDGFFADTIQWYSGGARRGAAG